MKRYKDAGITKDSSQEIEGLLRRGKRIESGRFHLLMSSRPGGRRGYVGSLQLAVPAHLHSRSMMTCIALACIQPASLSSLSLLQEATESSRTSSDWVDVRGRLEVHNAVLDRPRCCFPRRDKDRSAVLGGT